MFVLSGKERHVGNISGNYFWQLRVAKEGVGVIGDDPVQFGAVLTGLLLIKLEFGCDDLTSTDHTWWIMRSAEKIYHIMIYYMIYYICIQLVPDRRSCLATLFRTTVQKSNLHFHITSTLFRKWLSNVNSIEYINVIYILIYWYIFDILEISRESLCGRKPDWQ